MVNEINNITKKFNITNLSLFKKICNLYYDKKIIEINDVQINNDDLDKILKIYFLAFEKKDITFEIGYRYFRGNKIFLKKGVFVPQYDTEQIVDIINELNIKKGNALEIGSGSGAIAISLAKETDLKITSIDKNVNATNLSILNKKDLKIKFENTDFFKFQTNKNYNLIVSNPPYISEDDNNVDDWVKKNQPHDALYSKNNGLYFIEQILIKSLNILAPEGYIIIEIGFDQAIDVKKIAHKYYKDIEIKKDYGNYDRFLIVKNG